MSLLYRFRTLPAAQQLIVLSAILDPIGLALGYLLGPSAGFDPIIGAVGGVTGAAFAVLLAEAADIIDNTNIVTYQDAGRMTTDTISGEIDAAYGEIQELQSQYDLTFNLYNSLSQRQEQAKLNLQEETPVISVLQPVSVPLEDNTSGYFILVVFGIVGGITSLGWVLIEKWWQSEKRRFQI